MIGFTVSVQHIFTAFSFSCAAGKTVVNLNLIEVVMLAS